MSTDNYYILEKTFRENWNKNPPKCRSCLKPHYSYHYNYCKSCFLTWEKLGSKKYSKSEEEEKGKCLISDSDEEE